MVSKMFYNHLERQFVIYLMHVLCIFIVSTYPFNLFSQESLNPNIQTDKASNDVGIKLSTQKPPFIVKVLPAPEAIQESTEEKEYREGKITQDWLTTISTVLLAIGTIILAVFTYLLWRSNRKLIIDTKDTSKRELRAYLDPADGRLYKLSDNVLRAEISIKNSGKTPARKVRYSFTGDLRTPNDSNQNFIIPDLSARNQTIAPNSYWMVGHEFLNMTQEDMEDVYADRKLVYIWGQAEYFDIFGEQQTFTFRLRNVVKKLEKDLTSGQTFIREWNFYPEEEGNEAT